MKCKQCGKHYKTSETYCPTSYDNTEFCSQKCAKKYKKSKLKKKQCIICKAKGKKTFFYTSQPSQEWYCPKCRGEINYEKIDNDTISVPFQVK